VKNQRVLHSLNITSITTMIDRLIWFFVRNKFLVFLVLAAHGAQGLTMVNRTFSRCAALRVASVPW
jgi:hypothetical protein